MRRRFSSLAFAALLALALLPADPAMACTCVGPAEGEERAWNRDALVRADGAMIARLVRIRELGREAEDGSPVASGGPAAFVYRVRYAVKRPRALRRGRLVRVFSSSAGETCGIAGEVGQVQALFLHGDRQGRWRSGLCEQLRPRALLRAERDARLERRRAGARSRERHRGVGVCAGPRAGPGLSDGVG